MLDDADVMVAGGAEAPISEIGIAGFNACKALSTKKNDNPQEASRPYDIDRDGFVMGEGAGVVVLEELEHAKKRGAYIYGEILGYGLSGDAYHITAPSEDGDGGFRSMQAAIKRANLNPSDIDYINSHGTSTMADVIELAAVERLFGDASSSLTMSSTKSAVGHLLGAAGAIEAIFCILAMRDQIAPPTLNLDTPAVETLIDLAPKVSVKREINVTMSNSFGFGGTNASIVMGKCEA
jgi:3-oxoacyl-[acyl-carrier-protein] synthase II